MERHLVAFSSPSLPERPASPRRHRRRIRPDRPRPRDDTGPGGLAVAGRQDWEHEVGTRMSTAWIQREQKSHVRQGLRETWIGTIAFCAKPCASSR